MAEETSDLQTKTEEDSANSKYLCSYVFVSEIDPINFLSTYTCTLLFNMCKYYRAPYRFDDEDDSTDDCAEKSAIIRKGSKTKNPSTSSTLAGINDHYSQATNSYSS